MINIFILFIIFLIFISFKIIKNYLEKKKRLKLNNALNANYFIQVITNLIEENKYNLLEERIRLINIDAYGNEDLNKWIGNPPLDPKTIELNIKNGSKKFKEGIPYFWEKVIIKKFESPELFFDKWRSYVLVNPTIDDEILGQRRQLEIDDWFVFIASQIEKSCLKILNNNSFKKSNENYNKGINFENNCMDILKNSGWKVKETPSSGDQGVDLIASIDGLRVCIQCKNHEKAIGNKAVQEISAGKLYWKGTHAVLVSKSGFTKAAQKLANANNVELIHESELNDLEEEDRQLFLEELGDLAGGVDRVVQGGYKLLDLVTFYTLANDKLQAWQLPQGMCAPQAAGRIHSDMETGFIRAEVAKYTDLVEAGDLVRLREIGQLHLEGKEYVVEDGDVIQFLFKA